MEELIPLSKVPMGKSVIIEAINCRKSLMKRIYDMGMTEGSKITPVFSSPFGNPVKVYNAERCIWDMLKVITNLIWNYKIEY